MSSDVPGTHMAPETHSRDTAPLPDHSRRDCDTPDQNAPHLDDLGHPRDSRTDCDSARQRLAWPARDTIMNLAAKMSANTLGRGKGSEGLKASAFPWKK